MRIFLLILTFLIFALTGCSEIEDDETGGVVTPVDGTTDTTIMVYALPTMFDTQGAQSYAIIQKDDASLSVAGSDIPLFAIIGDCLESSPLDITGDVLIDSEVCMLVHEAYVLNYQYISFNPTEIVVDPSADASLMFAEIPEPATYHAIVDPQGVLHYLDRVPVRSGHQNADTVRILNGKSVFQSGNQIWEKDLSTDIETLKFPEAVDRFYHVDNAGGRHYVVIPSAGFVEYAILHKADGTDATIDLSFSASSVPIGLNDGIMADGRYIGIDGSGDQVTIKPTSAHSAVEGYWRSNQVNFDYWVDNGVQLDGNVAMPFSPEFNGVGVVTGKYSISDKVYKLGDVSSDLEVLNTAPYAENIMMETWSTAIACGGGDNLYLYNSHDAFSWWKVTWINDVAGESRIILDTHKITALKSSDDNVVLACGESIATGEMETIMFTEANTAGFTKTITPGCENVVQAP